MRTRKRLLSLLLCGALLFSLCPQTASAVSIPRTGVESSGLCEHHTEHNADCGYTEGIEGTPCGFVCEICGEETTATPNEENTVTVASVQAMIDALPTGNEITEDNAEEVKEQLEAIDEAKAQLSDEEIGELDFSRYTEAVTALEQLLYGAATPSNAVMLLADYDGPAIMLGASSIPGYNNGYHFVYYGERDSSPIKWRVLDNKTNTGESGLFLLSDALLGTGSYGGVYFNNSGNGSNAWQDSTARTWCGTFYGDNFSEGEQGAVLATTKSDGTFIIRLNSHKSIPFAASENILNGDKVFFLSAEEAANSAYGFTDDDARIANYGNRAFAWWLRSPRDGTANAGQVNSGGGVGSAGTDEGRAARPAFNLDLNSVLFTSAAVGGKPDGGLTEVPEYTRNEWKLTLLDKSRSFTASANSSTKQNEGYTGWTVDIQFTGAGTGNDEYVSAMLADSSGEILYYGCLAQNSANGTASVTIPSGLAAGSYKLKVFSEQYNGDYKTDYASAFQDISLTVVDTTAPTLSNGTTIRESETSATVKFTSSEAGSYYYKVVESGAAEPAIDTTAAGTACVNGENTISLTTLTAGAKDIYIVAKDAAGNVSEKLKIEIPVSALSAPQNIQWGSDTPGKATARWDAVTNVSSYSVRLYKDGQPHGNSVSVTGTSQTFTITEAGSYTFKVKATNTGNYADSDEAESGGLTFYAVTFETDGGSTIAPQIVVSGGKATTPTAPTKTDHTFDGWYSDSNLTTPYDFNSGTITADTTIYAKWTANSYNVTLNANGGTINNRNVTSYTYGVGATLPTVDDMTYAGHTFKGWYEDSSFSGNSVTAISATDTGDKTYHAKWEANTYNVTLNANGGTINNGNVTSYTYGTGATLPKAGDMTYTGHTFKGWYEDSNFSGNPVTEISATATGAKTYYAKWLSTDAGITAVSVDNTAGTINGTTITVVLPYGTVALPTENSKVSITAADGATVSGLTTTDGSEWTFTVTAADGQTTKNYTISVSIAPDPATGNRNDIAAAKSTVENHDWTVPQATANTEEAVKTWIEGQLAAMNLNGASYTVTMIGFTTATEGIAADRDGTNGSFAFTVKLCKGNDTGNIATSTYAEATVTISNGTVTATPYTKWTVTVNAGNGGSVSGGGTFEENTQVTVTATPNSDYHFVRWTENGAEVSTSASYSFTLTADRTLTAVFSRNSSGGYSYYTIKATAGAGGSISPSGNVSVREGRDQTFTITPDKGYAVANVKIDGKSIGAVKSYTFENVRRTHTIEVIFMKANGNPQTGVFVDVATGSYYEDAVDWAVEKGITNGVSSNMFAPDDPCTRAQIVTFLWRAAGSPAPKSMSSFTDVPADAFYAKAVAWAVENGITSGTGEGKFSPNAICTRAQSVTFLYRASGSPAVSGSAEFSDVSTTAFYADAVAWATKKGITTGIGGGLFGSDNDCTRSQIVTFLWRCKK